MAGVSYCSATVFPTQSGKHQSSVHCTPTNEYTFSNLSIDIETFNFFLNFNKIRNTYNNGITSNVVY